MSGTHGGLEGSRLCKDAWGGSWSLSSISASSEETEENPGKPAEAVQAIETTTAEAVQAIETTISLLYWVSCYLQLTKGLDRKK